MPAMLPFGASPPPPAVGVGANAYSSGATGSNPYAVNFGQIPWGQSSFPTNFGEIGPAYNQNYANALNFNKNLGNTINTGYNTTMGQQLAGQDKAMAILDNYGQSARQNIADTTAQQQGAMQQSMIGRGLGNTTVMDAGTRGINYDAGKQNLQLSDQIAQQRVGLQNQFNQQNTGQANQQANFLERMTGQYPNAGLSAQLAQQYGAAAQSAKNQARYDEQLKGLKQSGFAGTGGGGGSIGGQLGYVPQRATSPGYGGGGGGVSGGFGGGFSRSPYSNIRGGFVGGIPQGHGDALSGAAGVWSSLGLGGGDYSSLGTPEGADQGTGEGGPMADTNPFSWDDQGNMVYADPNYQGDVGSTGLGSPDAPAYDPYAGYEDQPYGGTGYDANYGSNIGSSGTDYSANDLYGSNVSGDSAYGASDASSDYGGGGDWGYA